jgi:hypothetical protein
MIWNLTNDFQAARFVRAASFLNYRYFLLYAINETAFVSVSFSVTNLNYRYDKPPYPGICSLL